MNEEEGMLERPKPQNAEKPVTPTNEVAVDAMLEEIASIDAGKVEAPKQAPAKPIADKPFWYIKEELAKRAGQKQENETQKTKPPRIRTPCSHFAEIDAAQKTKLKSNDVTAEVNRQWQEMAEKGLMMPCELDHERFAEAVKVEQRTNDFVEKEAELELIRDLTDKMSADAGMTLDKKSVADAIFKAEVEKEEKAERDLPDKRTVKTDIITTSCPEGLSIPLSREEVQEAFRRAEIRQKMDALRTEGLENVAKRVADAEKARDRRVELQVAKYEAATADKPIKRTFEQMQGLSDGTYTEPKLNITTEAVLQTSENGVAEQMLQDLEKAPIQDITRQNGDITAQRTVSKSLEATVEKEAKKDLTENLEEATFPAVNNAIKEALVYKLMGIHNSDMTASEKQTERNKFLEGMIILWLDNAGVLQNVTEDVKADRYSAIKTLSKVFNDNRYADTREQLINAVLSRTVITVKEPLQEQAVRVLEEGKMLEAIAEQETAKQKEEAGKKEETKKSAEKEKEKLEQDERCERIVTGQYKIVGKIGNGACGILYKAKAEITDKPVILKVSSNEDVWEGNDQIIAEATVHKFLHHPNIISIDSVVQDEENRLYAVMQEIEGAKKLDVAEKRSLKEIVRIIKSAAEIFDYAHKEGVLHRDIKPDNILIDKNGVPRIIDFGIAKVTDEKKLEKLRNTVSETGWMDAREAGTYKYIAPEITEGEAEPSPTTDVYSLGKVLYHMLMQSDKAPVIGYISEKVLKKARESCNGQMYSGYALTRLANITAKAVSDAEDRYKTMDELAKDLSDIINDLPDKIAKPIEAVKQEQKPNPNEFFISEDKDYFHLHNVNLDGKIYDYSWTKELLIGGRAATQDQHIARTKNAKEKLASLPVYNASITAVVKHKKNSSGAQKELADRVAQMFANDFRQNCMLTSTRVAKERKRHVVTHNFGYDSVESTVTELIEGYVTPITTNIVANSDLEETAQALFKTKNCAEIEQTYEDLTGRKPYAWIASEGERAVVLGCVYDWFGINCDSSINYYRPARGVVVRQKNLEEKINNQTLITKYKSLKLSAYRGTGLTFQEMIMKSTEYLTHINNILNAFGTSIQILPTQFSIDTEVLVRQAYSLRDASTNNYKFNWDAEKQEYANIDFKSKDEKITGKVSFVGRNCGRVNLTLVPAKCQATDAGLVKALRFYTQTKANGIDEKEVIWGSPKKKLEKAGFTLEYAIDLFDNNKFRSPEVQFEKGKKLYDVNGNYFGWATVSGDGIVDHKDFIVFTKGLPLRRNYCDFKTEQLIDLGDRYLLKP